MSRRNLIKKFMVIDNADTTTDPISEASDVSGVDFITYQLDIDPTVDANLIVSFSNDPILSEAVFTSLDFGMATTLVGATETAYLVHIENKGFKWTQIQIANNGGTGNTYAWITGAGRGA